MKQTTALLIPLVASAILLATTLPVVSADQPVAAAPVNTAAPISTAAPDATAGDVAAPVPPAIAPAIKAPARLKGGIIENVSPFIEDAPPQVIPEGTPVNLILNTTVNSEISQVGDEVMAAVTLDVKDKDKVVLPGKWYVCGKVARVESQRRLGRNGYVEIKFDKLISPDGKYQLPIDASLSTHEGTVKTVVKHLATDSKFVTTGAVAGTLLSVQITGIPGAIMTQGYSLAGGAAIGATVGLIAALWRKGKVSSNYTGESGKFRVLAPITLPTFNPSALPSAEPEPNKMANLDIVVKKAEFQRDPYGDKSSRMLRIDFALDNRTNREFSMANLVVMSDSKQLYYPEGSMTNFHTRSRKIPPNTSEQASITFGVASPKHKYWLVLLDVGNKTELTRVAVN